MSGHVFHPGHEELHGITVLVEETGGKTYLGRYHETTARGVILHDVAVHDPAAGLSLDDWLARQRKFGVHIAHKTVVIPTELAGSVRRFSAE